MTLPNRFTRSIPVLAVAALAVFVVGTTAAANGDVDIDKLEFVPSEITVNVGDKVTWTVTDAVPEGHTVTSGQPADADQGSVFDSGVGLTENGQTFEFTFEEPGTFPYYCQIHGAGMSGEVVVLEAGTSEAPAGSLAPSASAASSASAGPTGSEAPAASQRTSGQSIAPSEPGAQEAAGIPADRRLLAAGILAVAIVIMFGAAAVWRRLNPASPA